MIIHVIRVINIRVIQVNRVINIRFIQVIRVIQVFRTIIIGLFELP